MRKVILLLAGCLVSALLTPAAPAVAQAPEFPALGATNVLKRSKSFSRTVVIPAPATIDDRITNNPDFKVSGAGRVVGFSLVEANAILAPAEVNGLAVRFCGSPGCKSSRPQKFLGHAGPYTTQDPADRPLRPGRYFLTLITDGEPVKVTFKLGGLPGKAKFTSGDPVRQKIKEPGRVFSSPTGNAFAAGDSGTLKQNGVTLIALQAQSERSAGGFYGACLARGRKANRPPEDEYSAACMTRQEGAAALSYNSRVPPGADRAVVAHWATAEKEPLSHGIWAESLSAVVNMEPLFFWFEYPEPVNRTGVSSMMMQWDYPPS